MENKVEAKKAKVAGGVVVNRYAEVAVVQQNGNSWSLPKGHVEEGESDIQAARREIEEETGIQEKQLHLIHALGFYVRSKIGKHGIGEDPSHKRIIHMFLFTTEYTGTLKPGSREITKAEWMLPKDVAVILTHPRDKQFFRHDECQRAIRHLKIHR